MSCDHYAVRIRAARLRELGGPLAYELVELPPPGEGEVRAELKFGGVNPVDRYMAQGTMAPDGPLPRTLGGEAAGVVDDREVLIAGEGLGSQRDGVWAEAAVVPQAAVLPLPEGADPRGAAAMGVAGLTAWKCVHDLAAVEAADRVLVLGASGGVGSMIVSLGAAAGATVWGHTGTAPKRAMIEDQGAAEVVVGDADELADALGELEPTVVFDPLGDGFIGAAVDAMAVRGRLVSFGTSAGAEVSFNMRTLYRKMISVHGYGGMHLTREERRAGLEAALRALADGSLRVRIDDVLALEQVNEAFERP